VMEKLFSWADKLLSAGTATSAINPKDESGRLEG